MILIDASEGIDIPIDCEVVPWLERETGADLMISPKTLPPAEGMLPLHIAAGALLVQVKRGADLVSSFGYRLNHHIARMVEVAPRQWQRVLLPVGHYGCDKNGHVTVGKEKQRKAGDNRSAPLIIWYTARPNKDWKAYQTAMMEWVWRGGVVAESCKSSSDFWMWVENTHAKMAEAMSGDKVVWFQNPEMCDQPEWDDPLQRTRVVNDFRLTLATIPGIGPGRATQVWDYYGSDPIACLVGVTDIEGSATAIKGIGKGTVERARSWFQLRSYTQLGIEVVVPESNIRGE
uniref:Nuclease n=1 Tax=viral metagenome TaxID=1070528 RepID=A0A6M3K9I7_9ZZZZ